MKNKMKLAAAMLLAVPALGFAATYTAVDQAGLAPDAQLASLGQTGCVYAGVPLALGDILNYTNGSRQVCASGDGGPQMIDIVPAKAAKH